MSRKRAILPENKAKVSELTVDKCPSFNYFPEMLLSIYYPPIPPILIPKSDQKEYSQDYQRECILRIKQLSDKNKLYTGVSDYMLLNNLIDVR